MFGMVKRLFKEKDDSHNRIGLSELHVGCSVGFGFIPQKNISGCRLTVREVNSYIFGEDVFLAYRLNEGNTDINLIITGDDAADQHLALSQRVSENLYSWLFLSNPPEKWFDMKVGDSLEPSNRVMGMQQSWLAKKYTLAMTTQGNFLKGDYRLRKSIDRLRLSRSFEYILLIDEENEHALELEKYEDGTIAVFTTVYRPATDIGEISRAPRVSNVIEMEKPVIEKEHVTEAEPEETPDNITIHGKFGRIAPVLQTGTVYTSDNLLVCDTKLATELLGESQRNQLPISEIVRKVIDLPARVNEQVLFPFALSDSEYAELALRHELPASDREGVRQKIIEELKAFVGIKN